MTTLKGNILTIRIPDRDLKGREIKGKFTTIKGLCTFHGKNLFGEDSITIDRTPVFPFYLKDVVKIEKK